MDNDYKTKFVEPQQNVAVADVEQPPDDELITSESRSDHDVGWALAAGRDRVALLAVET